MKKKSISIKKNLNPGSFTGKFYQIYKKYLRLILCETIQEMEEQGMLLSLFSVDSISLLQNSGKIFQAKRHYGKKIFINI